MPDTVQASLAQARTRRAVGFLLHTITHRLAMDGAFFVGTTDAEHTQLITTGPDVEALMMAAVDPMPLRGLHGDNGLDRDAPWLIRNTADEPAVCDLPVVVEGGLGAYLRVPVRDAGGQVLGTLGCVHRAPRGDLGDAHVAMVQELAEILGMHLVQLAEGRARLGKLSARVAQLSGVVDAQEFQLEIYRRMVDASLNATLLLDRDTFRVEYANIAACELVGRKRAALLAQYPWDLHPCWEQVSLRRELAPLQQRRAWPVAYGLPPIDGAPAMDVQAQRFADDDGRVFVMWEGRDVETYHEAVERLTVALKLEQEAAEQLRQVDRLKTAFMSAVSHELRTPLTVLKGVAELLHRNSLDPALTAKLLGRLTLQAGRLDRLLTDLLDLNQFAHGSLEVRRELVDLAELVSRAVAELDVEGHPITFDLTPIDIEVAPVKVERIVANLVLNATIHTPPGTPIEVAVTPHTDGALLVVTDRGPGIPPDQRERIFEAFHQGDHVPTHQPGTGIGLSLVAAFTELHGGTAWVDEAPGGGSAFHVLLPTVAHSPATPTDAAA